MIVDVGKLQASGRVRLTNQLVPLHYKLGDSWLAIAIPTGRVSLGDSSDQPELSASNLMTTYSSLIAKPIATTRGFLTLASVGNERSFHDALRHRERKVSTASREGSPDNPYEVRSTRKSSPLSKSSARDPRAEFKRPAFLSKEIKGQRKESVSGSRVSADFKVPGNYGPRSAGVVEASA